tara:strand:+ start:4509 stop:5723 length:1215 start_codon:yes stop_codon:yes gene_type:complete
MTTFPNITEQIDLIKNGVNEIISIENLEKKLNLSHNTKTPLKIKLGCDPSRPDLHIGHSVVLNKLRDFQELGHEAILIIGDFTALIGDPSGRNITRPKLTVNDVEQYSKTYIEQASKILDIKKLKIVKNSEWLGEMNFYDIINLSSNYTVARMLERDDFEKRYKNQIPISIHEFLYPLAQAMDSVKLNSDVELGGTDQKFNLLVGRDLQKNYGQDPQIVITTPILEGTDGVKKMSKTYDNYIGITHSPSEIYGRTMSIPDNLIFPYFKFATRINDNELIDIKKKLDDIKINPRDLKRKLARKLITIYYDKSKALEAENEFDDIFIRSSIPKNIEEWKIKNNENNILTIMTDSDLIKSKSEAKRLINQGAVSIDGKKIDDINFNIDTNSEVVLKVGKRKFLKIFS